MHEEAPPDGSSVTKIMSIAESEFHRSIGRLYAAVADLEPRGRYIVPSGSGRVTILFEPLEPLIHGGLLSLPRARVTLCFEGLSDHQRDLFLARFDLTFRRGGG